MTTELPAGLEDAPASRLHPFHVGRAVVALSGLVVFAGGNVWTQALWLAAVLSTLHRGTR